MPFDRPQPPADAPQALARGLEATGLDANLTPATEGKAGIPPPPPPRAPGSLSPIPPSTRATLQARANQEMEWAREHRQEVFAAYATLEESMSGRIVNGDLFVTLLPCVDAHPEQVHSLDLTDLNYLAVDLYEQALAPSKGSGPNTVVILVGAAGAGKSTRARDLLAQHAGDIHTILDSNGANWHALREAVGSATRQSHTVDILYLGGDLTGAVARTVSRSRIDARVVPAEAQAFLHRAAPSNFLKAMTELQETGVAFAAYDTRTQTFSHDPAALATADLTAPANTPAGITRLLEELCHDQPLGTHFRNAFLPAAQEQP